MANLGQLSAIRGAVQGYDAGEMNEQELQKWLLNFKEQQNQFKVQSGQQQGYLDIAKDESKENLRGLKAKNNFQVQVYKELIDAGVPGKRAELESQDITNQTFEAVGQSKVNQGLADKFPDVYEKLAAGKYAQADVGAKTPEQEYQRGEEALRQQRGAADITTAEASLADYFVRQKAKANNLGLREGELKIQELQQKIAAMPLDMEANRAFMDSQIRRMDAATTREAYDLVLNQSMQDTIIRKAELDAEAIVANNKYLEGRTSEIATSLAQRDRELSLLQKELEDKLRTGPTPPSDAAIRAVTSTVMSTVNDMMLQVVKDNDDPTTREVQWDALKKSADAALMSVDLIGEWEPMAAIEKEDWFRNTKTLLPPKLLGFRAVTPAEKAALLRAPTATPPTGFEVKAATTRTPAPITGLPPAVRQQYVNRLKASTTDTEDDQIRSDFLKAGYSANEFVSIATEALQ